MLKVKVQMMIILINIYCQDDSSFTSIKALAVGLQSSGAFIETKGKLYLSIAHCPLSSVGVKGLF